MKKSTRWNFSFMGKIMMGLVLAAMIGGLDVNPAIAKDDHEGKGRPDKDRYEQRRYDRGRHDHRRPVYRTYGYRERVYYPPPVVYLPPPPPPGIDIFLPSIHIGP
ncbi:MAG TPA: hypothetical protein VN642_02955 [Dongiaceae bacterium]|nr:hypothetical protein [Dongiaceae bacterium]